MILFKITCMSCFTASLLKGLKHANIVLLHDIIHTKETLTLVFEYVVSKVTNILCIFQIALNSMEKFTLPSVIYGSGQNNPLLSLGVWKLCEMMLYNGVC